MDKSKKTELTVAQKAEAYLKDLEAFDKERGFTKIATPAWKLSQDTGVFSLVLQYQVAQLPKE